MMPWHRHAQVVEGFGCDDIWVTGHALRRYMQRFPAPDASVEDYRRCLELHLGTRQRTERYPLNGGSAEIWEIPDLDVLLFVGFNNGVDDESRGYHRVVVTILPSDSPTLTFGEAMVESVVKPKHRPPADVLRFGMLMVVVLGTEFLGMGVVTPDEDVIVSTAGWQEAEAAKAKRYQDRHLAEGLCPVCRNPCAPGKKRCVEHLRKYANQRAARRAAGLCAQCGVPSERYRCPACYATTKRT